MFRSLKFLNSLTTVPDSRMAYSEESSAQTNSRAEPKALFRGEGIEWGSETELLDRFLVDGDPTNPKP